MKLVINGISLNGVIIDPHYKEKHGDSVSDEIILSLVSELNGGNFPIEVTRRDFEYFSVEPVMYDKKPYRDVLVLCIVDDYLGVINAFRVEGGQ